MTCCIVRTSPSLFHIHIQCSCVNTNFSLEIPTSNSMPRVFYDRFFMAYFTKMCMQQTLTHSLIHKTDEISQLAVFSHLSLLFPFFSLAIKLNFFSIRFRGDFMNAICNQQRHKNVECAQREMAKKLLEFNCF